MPDDTWLTTDVITKTRMNRKTIFIDTGANIAALATTTAGQLAYCTSTGSGFIIDRKYFRNSANTAWIEDVADNDVEFYPHSTTIGDYSTPTAATVSSSDINDDFTSYTTQGDADAAWATTDVTKDRVNITNDNIDIVKNVASVNIGIAHDFGAGNISDTAFKIRFKVRFSTLTTAAASTIWIVCSSGNQTVDNATAQDSVGLRIYNTASPGVYAASASDGAALSTNESATVGSISISTDYFFEIERTSATACIARRYTDGTYTTVLDNTASLTIAATVVSLRYLKCVNQNQASNGTIIGTIDDVIVVSGVTPATSGNIFDNNTGTSWKTNSETNPNAYVTLSASADKEPSGVAIWTGAHTTATQIKIQTSPDAAVWTDKRLVNVSLLTHGQYNYIRFNRGVETTTTLVRYIRIYGNDGSAKVLELFEVKALIPTESTWNRRHGHKPISTTDATLVLSG